jgi:hypothetical protein
LKWNGGFRLIVVVYNDKASGYAVPGSLQNNMRRPAVNINPLNHGLPKLALAINIENKNQQRDQSDRTGTVTINAYERKEYTEQNNKNDDENRIMLK